MLLIIFCGTYPFSMNSNFPSHCFPFPFNSPFISGLVFLVFTHMISPGHEVDASLDCWPIQPSLIATYGIPQLPSAHNFPQIFPYLLYLPLDDVANEHILQIDNIPKSGPAYLSLKRVIGKTSMVAISGDHWKRVRKMFNPAFAPSHLDTLIPAIVEESMVFVDKLTSVAGNREVVKMNEMTTVKIPISHCLSSRSCFNSCFNFPFVPLPYHVQYFAFSIMTPFRRWC